MTLKIHKSLISHYSAFFEMAFSNMEFTEARTQEITIKDIQISAFGLLHHWLYFQNLKEDFATPNVTSLLLAKVWDLAERFLMPRLQNDAMEKLHARIQRFGDQKLHKYKALVKHAYASVKPKEDNHLLEILVEKFAFGGKEWLPPVDDFPTAFWKDVAEVLLLFHDSQPPKFRDKMSNAAEYHVEVKEDAGLEVIKEMWILDIVKGRGYCEVFSSEYKVSNGAGEIDFISERCG